MSPARSPAVAAAREQAQAARQALHHQVTDLFDAAATPLSDVYIGWVAAVDAAVCPARYRADGEDGWGFPGWSPRLAAGAAGRSALTHHLHTHHQADRSEADPIPLPDPVDAVRTWMQAAGGGTSRSPVARWVAELLQHGDRAAAAATAGYAGRWLGGLVRVWGWPLPADLHVVTDDPDDPVGVPWRKKHPIKAGRSRLTIGGSPDAIVGRVSASGDHSLVIHRPIARHDGELAIRAGFEAVAAALTTGVVPSEVLFSTGDTGEKLHVPVDQTLLHSGVAAITEVVRQRVKAATTADVDPESDARPSATCRYCDHVGRCPPGRTWLDAPGRLHTGLPLTVVG